MIDNPEQIRQRLARLEKADMDGDKEWLFDTLTVLLPKLCETCGGSKEVRCDAGCYKGKDDIYEQINPAHFQKCLKCNGKGKIPCTACQFSAGEVDDIYKDLLSAPNAIIAGEELMIIERQAKQNKRLETRLNWSRKFNKEHQDRELANAKKRTENYEQTKRLNEQIAQLEEGAFVAHEEARARGDQIERLEGEKKGLERYLKIIKFDVGQALRLREETKEFDKNNKTNYLCEAFRKVFFHLEGEKDPIKGNRFADQMAYCRMFWLYEASPIRWIIAALIAKQGGGMRTRDDIVADLRYEQQEGVHTFYTCKCDRRGCRGGKCSKCLEEELQALEEEG